MIGTTTLLALQLLQGTPNPIAADAGVAWVENRGQWPFAAEFVACRGSQALRLDRSGVELQLRQGPRSGALVRFAFEDPNPELELEGIDRRPEHYGFFFGPDPDAWQRQVPAYGRVAYREVWKGVDLMVGWVEGAPKYDVVVDSGADLGRVVFEAQGADRLSLGPDGALVLETAAGPVRQPRPVSFELDTDDRQIPVEVDFVLLPGNRFGFSVEDRDPDRTLVIDPGLIWSGYLGSSSLASAGDQLRDVALGPDGEAVVVGIADWGDFPVTPGAYTMSEFLVTEGVSVTVIDPSGTDLEYSCLLGAVEPHVAVSRPTAVRVGSDRSVFVVGWTLASTFPVTPGAFDTVFDSPVRAGFALKLTSDGSDLAYSTYLDASEAGVELNALALTPDDRAIVGGSTPADDFPVTPGAFDTTPSTSGMGILLRLSFDGSQLEWSTFLGNSADVLDLALDDQGAIYASGATGNNFPVTEGAYDTSWNGDSDAFVAKISPEGDAVLWATYLGGTRVDEASEIELDTNGEIVLCGRTNSFDFPTSPDSVQPDKYPGSWYDMFVARLSSDGSALLRSTHVGGIVSEFVGGLAVDAGGVITIAGAGGTGHPITAGAYKTESENFEGLITRLSPDLSRIFYSTFVGGADSDRFHGMAMDELGIVTACGSTNSLWDHPPDSFGPTYAGGQLDGIVVRFDPRPARVESYGTSTPGCHGPLVASVTEQPSAGSDTFSIYVSGAPPESAGVLGLGTAALDPGLPIGNLLVFVDPASAPTLIPVTTGPTPFAEVLLPIPAPAAGATVYAQFVFVGTADCGGAGSLAASNGLAMTVQN